MSPDGTLQYTNQPQPTLHCPSVDVFFHSVSQHWPQPGHGILLTGMGRDGAQGLAELKAKGWHTIAESEASCAIYGMPRAAVERGAATQVLPVSAIAQTLQQRLFAD